MGQVIAFSLKRKRVKPIRFLPYTLLFWRLLRYSAVASIVMMAPLAFFPLSLAHASPVLYIPHQFSHTLSVMDGSTYSMIKNMSVDCRIGGIAVSPDGKSVFVTISDSSSVSVIDTKTNTVTNTISVGGFPYSVAVSPDGKFAYVSVQSGGGNGTVSVIDTSAYGVVSTINVGKGPQGVAFHPDGSRVYITNYSDASVSVIDTASRHVIETITVGGGPSGIAVHPSGSYVYTVNQFDHTLSVIGTASYSVIKTVSIGQYPSGVAIDPLGKFIYAVNWGEGSVSVVDVSSNSVVKTISVGSGSGPGGISFDASGLRAYVVNTGSDSISVIDTASQAVIVTVSTGTNPIAFGKFVAEPMIPSPRGANSFATYTDAVIPLLDSDPGKSKPIGMGTIAGVGSILNLSLGANKFSSPMDVYLALSMPAIDPSGLFLFTSSGLKPLSAGLLPLKTSVTDISGVVVPDLDALILPSGTYTFYLLVVPAGTPTATLFNNSYLWSASLSVVRASDVANKAIALFGTDLAAAVAIFLANDKGYSLDQIIAAIDAGTLSSLGEIQGAGNTSSGLRAGKWGGVVADAYCAQLDPTNPIDRDSCATLIAEALEELREDVGITAERLIMLEDVGYTSVQIDAFKEHGCCELTDERIEVKCCKIKLGICDYSDCGLIEPADPPTNKLTEVLDVICPVLGGNSDSRIVSKNPFISFQAASPVPGLRLASPADSCTPICTDSDGDGYYVQSGCGTGGAVDCNDGNGNINPGILESCADGVDNNCDGKIDTQDPGCNPLASCPDPDYPTLCGPMCHVSGAVCCDDTGQACAAGKDCCGTACMPAGNVCCAPVGHCPPGSTCDYENKRCISSGTGGSDFLTHATELQPLFEGSSSYDFAIKDTVD